MSVGIVDLDLDGARVAAQAGLQNLERAFLVRPHRVAEEVAVRAGGEDPVAFPRGGAQSRMKASAPDRDGGPGSAGACDVGVEVRRTLTRARVDRDGRG